MNYTNMNFCNLLSIIFAWFIYVVEVKYFIIFFSWIMFHYKNKLHFKKCISVNLKLACGSYLNIFNMTINIYAIIIYINILMWAYALISLNVFPNNGIILHSYRQSMSIPISLYFYWRLLLSSLLLPFYIVWSSITI